MESFLEIIGRGNVKVTPLITHRFPISKADEAFKLLVNPGEEDPIGAVITYDPLPEKETIQTITLTTDSGHSEGTPRVGFIGPGSFARNVLLPALMKQKVTPVAIAGTTGMSPTEIGKRYNFSYVTTETGKILEDTTINTVFITTRHDSHAELVVKALRAGKNVYVEKPLATTVEELQEVCNAYNDCNGSVMVGFNRRFAPFSVKTKQFLPASVPPVILIRVNAGPVDERHWTMSEDEGGGRIIGEACHFIDLMQFIAGAPITCVYAQAQRESPNLEQNLCATITFQNGAVGTLLYTAQGDTSQPKEYMEFYAGGKVAVINDFHELTLVAHGKATTEKKRQDKGFEEEMKAYVAHLRDGIDCPIPFGQSVITTLATIALLDSCRAGKPIDIPKVSLS